MQHNLGLAAVGNPALISIHLLMKAVVDGRFCAPVAKTGLVCCLPCPMTDFLYPKNKGFNTAYRAAEVLNVVGLILLVFMLITYAVLPAETTRRHYLSYCLIIAAIFMALGFVIPFGAQPEQCYDKITPNDMYSSLTCAFSGAFILSGGMSMGVWIFIRALSMHLQICWDVTPGKKFFYWAQGLGWAVAATFFTLTITITGVSFRFGDVCHVNAEHSMQDFWGPLLAIAGGAMVIQVATFVYCIKVYLQNMFSDEATETQSSAGLPSYTTSLRKRSARVVYRRVRKVLYLQWRGIMIVVRWSMIGGWRDFIRSKFSKNREFVSLDARKPTEEILRQFELKSFDQQSPPTAYSTPGLATYALGNVRSDTPDHFNKEIQREYRSPTQSFSAPRPQSRAQHIEWDPRSSMARGGLGLHPPSDYDRKIRE
ncbi:G- coupled receptor [Pyrenophora seminiperda CCB06]|uniref:G-coupled receptor n=1 Tax=Pyrenophora seminiperda CCB06 TaxID=1302712 RepID=A0A3M7LXC7_9PLEO|nr:G- coupled receptor [Pyrenophora seminiperda CCB06]